MSTSVIRGPQLLGGRRELALPGGIPATTIGGVTVYDLAAAS